MAAVSPEAKERARIYKREDMRRRRAADPQKYRDIANASNARHRERRRVGAARWKRENPEAFKKSIRKTHLKQKYGMTPDQWQEMFLSQCSKCACCGSTEPNHKTGWRTDHNHETGKVRGIVCQPCNQMLTFHITIPILLKAAKYLRDKDHG